MKNICENNFSEYLLFVQDLNELASIVRGEIPKLARANLCALITIDVHGRDMITGMVKSKVDAVTNFEWQKQLRYYWDLEMDNCVVRMSNSLYVYGYEYLGASPRLVITPLTVKCDSIDFNPFIDI